MGGSGSLLRGFVLHWAVLERVSRTPENLEKKIYLKIEK